MFGVPGDGHLTATDKKHLPIAYNYCQENGINECTVNHKMVWFNFKDKEGYLRIYKGSWNDSTIKRFCWE